MRILTCLLAVFTATAAQAHPGHIAEIAGHNHWLGGAAIGLAIAIGLWKAGKAAKENAEAEAEEEDAPDAEPQEA